MSDAPDFYVPRQGERERDTARVRFYVEAVENKFKSGQAGHPVYDNIEMAHILVPGDRKTEVSRIVNDEIRRRFPEAYDAFKRGLEEPAKGTPLSQWLGISAGQVEELRHAHVRTVEELAELSDDQLSKALHMGGMALREKARRALEQAAGAAPMEKLAAENAEKDAKIAALEAQVRDMNEKFDAFMAQRAAGAQA